MNANIRFSLCATAMVLFAGTLHAGWTSPTGDPVADNEAMRSTGLFGAQLVLTTDDAALRKNWIATQGPPVLPATTHLRQGQNLHALILFHGCKANAFGYCNVVADYSVQSPDGTITPIGTGPVWKGVPSKMGYLQLGQVSANIPFASTSPSGVYTVRAVVRDTVANAVIPLANSRLTYKKP